MQHFSRVLLVATALGVAAIAGAQGVLGTWHGKMTVNPSSLPPNLTPEQKKMAMSQIEMVKKVKFLLTVNKDKSFKINITGGPQGQEQNTVGKWTQKANAVTFTPTDKKPGSTPMTMALSKDGKQLVAKLPPGMANKASLVFTR